MVSRARVMGEETHKASLLILMLASFSLSFSACTVEYFQGTPCEALLQDFRPKTSPVASSVMIVQGNCW